jgi:hypothetical protein
MYIAPKQKHTDLKPFKNQLFRKLGGVRKKFLVYGPGPIGFIFRDAESVPIARTTLGDA